MPITRRRRANPPEPSENNASQPNSVESSAEAQIPAAEPASEAQPVQEQEQGTQEVQAPSQPVHQERQESTFQNTISFQPYTPGAPAHPVQQPQTPLTSYQQHAQLPPFAQPPQSPIPPAPFVNGDRDRYERGERQDYTSSIESGRRTPRGELFRRPPQPPVSTPQVQPSAHLQPPAHEITLPLGNLLHLAYNPGYTGSDEARSELLQKLAQESKNGGRARCWNCGSLGIVYDRWSTRSKTFGEVGIAFCEICGVWSVM